MSDAMRILVASPLGHVVAAPLQAAINGSTIVVATNEAEVISNVSGRVRFDVVSADLVWNNPNSEWTFDGLDVIEVLRLRDRLAPVLLATQGHSMELDLLDEAARRDEVVGTVAKSDGFAVLVDALRTAALGRRVPSSVPTAGRPSLHELFTGQRGQTAGRLAGAIAASRATDSASLARVAKVSPNTANKVTSLYLGPIITRRGEHDPDLPLTQAAVYRWCGLHARYLVSWCRRNGHLDVLSPETGAGRTI